MIEEKKKIKYLDILLFVVLLLIFGVLMTSAQDVRLDPKHVKELTEKIGLTPEQVADVKKIFVMSQEQAKRDRVTYRSNALALIQAAEKRRQMTDKRIEELLNTEQMEKFDTFKKEREKNVELFELTEGLMLTDDQILKVGIILEDYEWRLDELNEKMKEMRENLGEGMPGKRGGGMRTGGMRGGGMRGGGMRGGMGRRGGRMGPFEELSKVRKEKEKKIKELLSKKQKKLYKQILKEQKKKMEKRMSEMRRKMRNRYQ